MGKEKKEKVSARNCNGNILSDKDLETIAGGTEHFVKGQSYQRILAKDFSARYWKPVGTLIPGAHCWKVTDTSDGTVWKKIDSSEIPG